MVFSTFLELCLQGNPDSIALWKSHIFTKDNITEVIARLSQIGKEDANYSHALLLQGLLAEQQGNDNTAISCYEEAMGLGNSNAMTNRAYMYKQGKGSAVNYPAAIELYEKAILLGNCTAMNYRASMHIKGQGGPVNFGAAIDLYDKAITTGSWSAKYNRAQMYFKGEGDRNQTMAIKLYYEVFCTGNMPSLKSKLERLAKEHPAAQSALILINLCALNVDLAQELYQTNSQQIAPMLCDELISLVDKLPLQMGFTKKLLAFINHNENDFVNLEQWHYIKFKIHLYNENEQEALRVYQEHLINSDYLTASELFRLGNVQLLSVAHRIEAINKACQFYYQAYQKGDEHCYILLIKFLREKDALETNQEPLKLHGIIENSSVNDDLINRFLKQQKPTQINQPSETKKSFFSWFKNKLKPKADSELEYCKSLIQQQNSGQLIYEALRTHDNFSSKGLKILARHKDKTLDYMKLLKDEDRQNSLNEVLHQHDSMLKQYFHVQRGFFKPRAGHGTLKALEDMEREFIALK